MGTNVTCVPSLVGGEVIGSVLITHASTLDSEDTEALSSSLAEAAPIVANLRNLAIAETRAATDSLTGLPNNRAVHETLKRLSAQAGRTAEPLAVVLFDLDHFKDVNDTHGHGKGDEVLAAVGDTVANAVRDSDFVGRYGGEEFLALLPSTGREGAVELAEKLQVGDLAGGGGRREPQGHGELRRGRPSRRRGRAGAGSARRGPGALHGQGQRTRSCARRASRARAAARRPPRARGR